MTDKAEIARMNAVLAALDRYDDAMVHYVTDFKSQRDDADTMVARSSAFAAPVRNDPARTAEATRQDRASWPRAGCRARRQCGVLRQPGDAC